MSVAINDVPVSCINQAALIYHVPATIILAIMKKENGRNGLAVRNKNGTHDYGVFQINSIWLPKIAQYGYTRHDIQYDPCKNVQVATWIIAKHMAEGKTVWRNIANYHSRTPVYNQRYQQSVYAIHHKLVDIIAAKNT